MSGSLTVDDLLVALPSEQSGGHTLRAEQTAPPAAEVLPGVSLDGGHLRLLELLGEGGMGLVHAAEEAHLGRVVAVKRLRPELGARARAALVAEARLTGSLEHPNIVPVHTLASDEDGAPVMVMKRIEGASWLALLKAGPAAPGWPRFDEADTPTLRAVRVLLEVCRAVAFAHRRGVLHRDLKPDNVLISPHGEVTVADWGIACPIGRAASLRRLAGSPAYMAPEQVTEGALLTEATDIFLLGATLLEATTGRPPHHGRAREALAAAAAWAGLPQQSALPTELEAICRRALAPEPAERFASVDEMAAALRAFIRHEAARQLLDATTAREARLEAAELPAAQRAAERGAIRFGYQQVLASWPESAEARDALIGLLGRIADEALSREAPEQAAEALASLSELGADAPARAARLEQLRAELSARRRQALEQDMAASASGRLRVFSVFFGLAVAMAVTNEAVPWLQTAEGLFAGSATFAALSFAGMVAFRRRLLVNEAGRQIVAVLSMLLLLSLLQRGLLVLDDGSMSLGQSLSRELLGLGACMFALGTFSERTVAVHGVVVLAGGILAGLMPESGVRIFHLTLVGLTLLMVVFERLRWG